MKKYLLLLTILTLAQTVQAAIRSKQTMLRLAQQQVSQQRAAMHRSNAASELKLLEERPQMSVYSDGELFAIISSDDRYDAVLAYGTGAFDVDSLPANVRWWMEAVEQAMHSGVTSHRASSYTPVEPLMTTKWGQDEPFNNLLPEVKDEEKKSVHAPTGCVATAMAQIMNLMQFPASVNFLGTYTVDGSSISKTKLVMETFEYPYKLAYGYYFPDGYKSEKDYEEMPYTEEEADAIARLMRACGYAVNMGYAYEGSGAATYDAAAALSSKFQYPEVAVKMLQRDYFTTKEWLDILSNEFQNGCAVLYGGYGTETGDEEDLYGHAFVFHGMDSEGRVYVNWGWQGACEGYYAIDLLAPDEETHFNLYQDAIIGIRPTALSTDNYQSMLITDKPYTFSYSSKSSKLTLALKSSLYNVSLYDLEGQVRLTVEDKTDAKNVLTQNMMKQGEVLESYYGWEASDRFAQNTVSFTSGHTYQAYLESKDDREAEWQKVRTIGGAFYYELTCNQKGEVTVSDPIFIGAETPTAIQTVAADIVEDGAVRYYDLQGRQLDADTHGLVIMKQGSKVTKVFK